MQLKYHSDPKMKMSLLQAELCSVWMIKSPTKEAEEALTLRGWTNIKKRFGFGGLAYDVIPKFDPDSRWESVYMISYVLILLISNWKWKRGMTKYISMCGFKLLP